MNQNHDEICLVTSSDSPWAQSFREFVGARYRLSTFRPDELPREGEGEGVPAKGVVVFYEHEASPNDAGWVARIRRCVRYVDVPLVAVTSHPSPAIRTQLLAAGASTVCDAEEGPEAVIKEVVNRCNVEPVVEEMRERLLDPFVNATLRAVREMAGEEVRVQALYRKQGYRVFGDQSAILSLSSRTEGTLVVSFPQDTSYALARGMLAPLGEEVTEQLVQSCLAELANIIAGQAKGQLADTEYHFSMSVPTVVSGPHHEIRYKPGLPCLVAAFTGPIGDFALQLCMAI